MDDFETLSISQLRHYVNDHQDIMKTLQDHIAWAHIAPTGSRADHVVIQENIRLTLKIEKLQNELRALKGE